MAQHGAEHRPPTTNSQSASGSDTPNHEIVNRPLTNLVYGPYLVKCIVTKGPCTVSKSVPNLKRSHWNLQAYRIWPFSNLVYGPYLVECVSTKGPAQYLKRPKPQEKYIQLFYKIQNIAFDLPGGWPISSGMRQHQGSCTVLL
jgi:hypothetical protein